MKANVYDLEGKAVKTIELPEIFSEEYREEIIRRAVLSEESKEYQPKGAYRWAGLETSAEYVGRKEAYRSLKNRGQAMLPREFYGGGIPGRVRRIPSAVGGRRAHPPKPEKKIVEKINKKEWLKALRSAIAATANLELVKKRGHKTKEAPIILTNDVEKIKKTKDIFNLLMKLIPEDLKRSKEGKKRITGVRRRKHAKKYPKSALIVTTSDELIKAARNIAGVDAVKPEELKVKLLAPGTHAGRLTIYTESALEKIEELWGRKW